MSAEYTYDAVEAAALRELGRRGLAAPGRPPSEGWQVLVTAAGRMALPDDPSALSDGMLSQWQAGLAAWRAYAEAQVGVARAVAAKAEHRQAAAEAVALAGASGTITDRRAVAKADPDALAAGAVVAQARARAELVGGVLAGIVAHAMVLAQEMRRRSVPVQGETARDGRR